MTRQPPDSPVPVPIPLNIRRMIIGQWLRKAIGKGVTRRNAIKVGELIVSAKWLELEQLKLDVQREEEEREAQRDNDP
jgi:hypothetical protein